MLYSDLLSFSGVSGSNWDDLFLHEAASVLAGSGKLRSKHGFGGIEPPSERACIHILISAKERVQYMASIVLRMFFKGKKNN